MGYRTSLELITQDRLALAPNELDALLNRALHSLSNGLPIYLIEQSGGKATGLKMYRPAELAKTVSNQIALDAPRLVLAVPLDANDAVLRKLRHHIENMPRVTRPLARAALQEALEELVKLRTALGLSEKAGT